MSLVHRVAGTSGEHLMCVDTDISRERHAKDGVPDLPMRQRPRVVPKQQSAIPPASQLGQHAHEGLSQE